MLKLLTDSLAREFYQQHAGFFLFGLYILFGIVGPGQLIEYHKARVLAGISSPEGLILVFSCWFLYAAKAHFFLKQKLNLPQYTFIKETSSQVKNIQLRLWLKFYSVILLPVLIYVVLLIGLSLKYHFYSSAISIILVFSALFFGLAWLRFQAQTFGFLKQKSRQVNNKFQIKKPFFSWPIFYLFSEQPLMLLICKIISFILFKGILWMFADIGIDIRILLIALLASVLCHAVLVFNLLNFETRFLTFSRSLPIKFSKRAWNWLFTFAIILIPEWLFLTIAANYRLAIIANGILFGLAGLFFLQTLLYLVKLDMESYLKWLLPFFFIAMLAILSQYYLLFSILLIICSFLFYLFKFKKIDLRDVE